MGVSISSFSRAWDEKEVGYRTVRDGSGVGRVDVPALEGLADDLAARGGDDGDVGDARVRGADVDADGHVLADGPLLDVVLVVGVLVALAEPDVAFGGVVVVLRHLQLALHVAVVVALLVVVHLLAAGGGHGVAGHARAGAGDEAVGAGEREHGGRGQDVGAGVLHFGCLVV